MSYKTRLEANLNRERREREREKAARLDPVFAQFDAQLAAIGWPRKQHVFGTRGPRSDPDGMLTEMRDRHVALDVESREGREVPEEGLGR